MVLILIVIALVAVSLLETARLALRHSNQAVQTSRLAATGIGLIAGFIGAEHGYYEILQCNQALKGVFFDAISGTSLLIPPTTQWTGWPAMTLIPNFLVTGIFAILISLVVMTWAVVFVQRKNGGFILILLSILMLLVGGGFIPPFFGIIAGMIGARIKHG